MIFVWNLWTCHQNQFYWDCLEYVKDVYETDRKILRQPHEGHTNRKVHTLRLEPTKPKIHTVVDT